MSKTDASAPLSPTLLAGLPLKAPPLRYPLQLLANAAMSIMLRQHPRVFERLNDFNGADILVIFSDLPFRIILHINQQKSYLRVIDPQKTVTARATIRSPFLSLRDLMEGRLDGDALFFSRDLIVEGDTELIVALRNAVDGEEIDLVDDVLSQLGPFTRPAQYVTKTAASLWEQMSQDLEMLRTACVAPIRRQSQTNAKQIKNLNERINTYEKQSRRLEAALRKRQPTKEK